jgi:thioesterase domain-containing protein
VTITDTQTPAQPVGSVHPRRDSAGTHDGSATRRPSTTTCFSLLAPLAPNVNDKGCAFGGSLVSLMTLCGWALVELALRRRGEDCDVFVAESTVRYLSPLWQDFRSEARLAADADWPTFFRT